MLKKISDLPENVLGLRAEGQVTKGDYETVVIPLLEEAHNRRSRICFLYHFAPEFLGFTAGAALDDFRVGLKYFHLFEKCAVVSDTKWLRDSVQLFGSLTPFPVRVFQNDQLKDAIEWLSSSESDSKLSFEMKEDGILIVRPQNPLRKEDFSQIGHIVDPWIKTHGQLKGLVICTQKFPGWKNIGSFIRHVEFIIAHQKKVRRIAIATDGTLPKMMSHIISYFVKPKVKQFPFERIDAAIQWASSDQHCSEHAL